MAKASQATKAARNTLDSTLLKTTAGSGIVDSNHLMTCWETIKSVVTLRRLAFFFNKHKKKLSEGAKDWLSRHVKFSLETLPVAPTKYA